MQKTWLAGVIVLAYSQCVWATYGPSLARVDSPTALRACHEAQFRDGERIVGALQSENPAEIVQVLGDAIQELRTTSSASVLYAARAFCVHELVPSHLPREGSISSPTVEKPTALVRQFQDLGIAYFYYDPDAEWVLRKDPVDLNDLAKNLDSPWGRRSFLMMTRLGWSQGSCEDGPDQFRQVINHGERFLRAYPESDVSNSVRLEVAHAYETWWNVSRQVEKSPGSKSTRYKAGAETAKQRAVQLYKEYLTSEHTPEPDVQSRLTALQVNPKGTNHYDYFCPDYED
jgi:hypothetical protein